MNHNIEDLKQKAARMLVELKKLYPNPKAELNYTHPYEFLIAVILSAQCTDKTVNRVTADLFKKYTTLDSFADVDPAVFAKDISSITFFYNKAKNIVAAAKKLRDDFGGKLPQTIAQLTTLPGVARKTANVVLGQLYGINEGMAVDTHVKRLAKAFGLTSNTDPVKVEQDLMAIVPQKDWNGFSLRLILYGRYHWTAKQKEPQGVLAEFAV
jgi:endonuclease III